MNVVQITIALHVQPGTEAAAKKWKGLINIHDLELYYAAR